MNLDGSSGEQKCDTEKIYKLNYTNNWMMGLLYEASRRYIDITTGGKFEKFSDDFLYIQDKRDKFPKESYKIEAIVQLDECGSFQNLERWIITTKAGICIDIWQDYKIDECYIDIYAECQSGGKKIYIFNNKRHMSEDRRFPKNLKECIEEIEFGEYISDILNYIFSEIEKQLEQKEKEQQELEESILNKIRSEIEKFY